jgi:hypothetical protein
VFNQSNFDKIQSAREKEERQTKEIVGTVKNISLTIV